MKIFKFLPFVIGLGVFISAAQAVPVLTSGSWDGAGQNLSDYFTTWGVGQDVNADQIAGDAYWNDKLSNATSALMMLEVAGNAPINTFGIFQQTGSVITRTEVFNGAASAGATATLSLPIGAFGFYLGYNGTYFYSDSSLNADGADQMVAYQGPSASSTLNTGVGNLPWDSNSYLIAWEDLPYASSDKDFNDLVLIVRTPTSSVPETGSTSLLIFVGLAVVLASARRGQRALFRGASLRS